MQHTFLIFRANFSHFSRKATTQERLNKAKEFLAQTNIHLYDVCYKVGYLSPSYFSRLFKKYTGQTPGEYRENIMLNARPAAEKEAEQL